MAGVDDDMKDNNRAHTETQSHRENSVPFLCVSVSLCEILSMSAPRWDVEEVAE
jgi:hypothetical protein